jgi:hypothetical protein
VLPAPVLADCFTAVLTRDPVGTLQYGNYAGYAPLRALLAEQYGVTENEIFVSNGSLQLMDFIAAHLVRPGQGDVVLVEQPFFPRWVAFQNAPYVLNSTAHWRPLMNGYSGYTPESYRRVAWTFWYFPRDHAIQAMREAGVTHFTVHPQRFGNGAAETLAVLAKRQDIELVAIGARGGIRLYRFR